MFTAAQQQAINCNAENILVSAAAGSGKTAVLTERILRHISNGINIDNLLVVTFTEAASAEMRERIEKRMHESIEKKTHVSQMISQVARLPMVSISTIHSFCRKLVQENFQIVDIDPAFRVGDTAELEIIRTDVINELFEKEYSEDNNEGFLDLADVYGGKTLDGRLDVLVRNIHDFMESEPFPHVAAQNYIKHFYLGEIKLEETPWARVVREELASGLEGAIEGLNQALLICNKDGGPNKYIKKLSDELQMLVNLQKFTGNGHTFEDMYEAFSYIEWGRLPGITEKDNVNANMKSRVQNIRDEVVKKRINKLVEGVFFAPPSKMQADLSALTPRVSALLEFAMKFSEAYAAEKRARNILDFSDLEHFAIKILYPYGPENMKVAQIYQFYEVLIDEYQDSNEVQELILSAVAQRRFMVGDVKQSIYRFRRANPKLFLQKYNDYADGILGTRIDLSHNFRSRPEVLDAVNFFFCQLMSDKLGEVNYDSNAALYPGHPEYPALAETNFPETLVELVDDAKDENDEETLEITDENEENPDKIVAETRVIAKCISELFRSRKISEGGFLRPCVPNDVVVLTRSLSSVANTVVDELKRQGIDAIAEIDSGFLEQQEVKIALAFLRVTDNPRQDIDLATVLYSPVYGLTMDDLLEIKLHPGETQAADPQTQQNFYDHLNAFAKSQKGELAEKVKKFLSDLNKWREAALYLPISRLIGLIFNTTQLPSYVLTMENGTIRQGNLRLLLERAIEFEETSLKGLFHFIHYIKRLYDSGVKSGGAIAEPSASSAGRVRVMTIHKSKGLEFPVVICAFLGKQFNTDDLRRPVILHSELGVGPYYVNTIKRTRSNTLARFSSARLSARENLSEELRCLYVAMTRAKELLILTGCAKNLSKSIHKWGNCITAATVNLPWYSLSGTKSYLDWIMPCLLRHRAAAEFATSLEADKNSILWNHSANFKIRVHKTHLLNEIAEKVGEFPITALKQFPVSEKLVLAPYSGNQKDLPSKLSITEIKRLYDITPDSTVSEENEMPPTFEPPEFIKTKRGLNPMQIGTAMHVVTEHLNYSLHINVQALENLLAELTAKNLLTHEEAALVDRKKILLLTNSPLAQRIRNSPNVNRETPFILALPAKELYADNPAAENETVLVHGIIDCYFEEEGEIVLVDFKSDAQFLRHTTQMKTYKKAIENSTAMNVKEVLIYSFALGKAISLTDGLH